ncbi:MAG: NlpC/P60 family protein [Lachnospiraceae bacterium]|nr:NlpC/P60 family protein [Lachnospiraceae bacterium]
MVNSRWQKRIGILMLAAALTCSTVSYVSAAPEDGSAQESGTENTQTTDTSAGTDGSSADSGTEAGESVESSSEEEKYDYASALTELEDLENQLDAAEADRDAVLEQVRALDTRKDRQLSTLNEDDQKKAVAMAAVTSGAETLSGVQTQMDSVSTSYEQSLRDKDKALDDLHTGDISLKKIHAYRDAVRKTVQLKKQQTILQSELDTLTEEQQALEDNLKKLQQVTGAESQDTAKNTSADTSSVNSASADTDTSASQTAETIAPADETVLEKRSDRYLELTKSQNGLISQAIEAENKVASLQKKVEDKADEIRKALDDEQSSFDDDQQAFDEEEQAYQEQLAAAAAAVGSSVGTSSASGGQSASTSSGTGSGTNAGGDENVITRDNNGNVRIVTVHPDGTTSVANGSADASGLGETTTNGSISSGSGSGTASGSTENAGGGTSTSDASLGQQIVDYAVQFVGNPYVWGGTSLTNGCDCSGFVQSVFAHFGINLSRTTYTQQYEGKEVSYADIQPGDVIYYSGHTAIYMGNNQIVHAANSRDGIKISNDPTYMTIVTIRRFY